MLGGDSLNLTRAPRQPTLFPPQVVKRNTALTAPGSHCQTRLQGVEGKKNRIPDDMELAHVLTVQVGASSETHHN